MKRPFWFDQLVCLAAACSLLGQIAYDGLVPDSSHQTTRMDAAPEVVAKPRAAASQLPTDTGPSCGAAGSHLDRFLLKESDRLIITNVSPKPSGQIMKIPRTSLRGLRAESDSQLLWVQTASSSLSARHVRIQV